VKEKTETNLDILMPLLYWREDNPEEPIELDSDKNIKAAAALMGCQAELLIFIIDNIDNMKELIKEDLIDIYNKIEKGE